MDVSPTILDYLGIDYNSAFFGRSLLSTSPAQQRVLMSHNRDASLLEDSAIAVPGIQGDETLWKADRRTEEFRPLEGTSDTALLTDAIAYYMTAYDMFKEHRLGPLAD